MPRAEHRLRVLSPFDNAIILRERNLALHGFDYQLECYLPEAKRNFGYFCLPLLYGGTLIGRADCKAHRRSEPEPVLEIRHLHLEKPTHIQPDHCHGKVFMQALKYGLEDFARFNACKEVRISRVSPESLNKPIRALF